jgi:hypothetical protein
MITRENDDSVIEESAVLQNLNQLANAVVNVRDSSVVRTSSTLDLIWSEVLVPEIADFEEALGVVVLLILLDSNIRERDVDIFIKVPVLLLNAVRVVGVSEGDGHAEWSSGGAFADVVVEELFAPALCQRFSSKIRKMNLLVHDLLVVIQLVAANARSSLFN